MTIKTAFSELKNKHPKFHSHLKGINNGKWIEIGVWHAKNAKYVLDNLDIEKIYLIDPYMPLDYAERFFGTHELQDENERIAREKLAEYEEKCVWIKKTSENASDLFDDNSVDVVYVDGNHSYEHVLSDCEKYWEKIKPGGLQMGDDINESGVKEGVRDFLIGELKKQKARGAPGNPSIEVHILHSQFPELFYVVKPQVETTLVIDQSVL